MNGDDPQNHDSALVWRCGEVEFDFIRMRLRVGDNVKTLETHTLSVLICLIQAEGKTVSREFLLQSVWPDRDVPDLFLQEAISELRHALDDPNGKLLRSVGDNGYQLPASQSSSTPHVASARVASPSIDVAQIERGNRFLTRLFLLLLLTTIAIGIWLTFMTHERPTLPVEGPTIAVLPFIDRSLQQDDIYLSEGLAEDVLNQLAQIRDFYVIARTSSFVFKDESVAAIEVASQLHADYLVRGVIEKHHDTLSIDLQLFRQRDNTVQWHHRFDGAMNDLPQLQNTMVQAIATELKVIQNDAASTEQRDPNAYALYLQARKIVRGGTHLDYQRANALYREALQHDPKYVAALVGLAANYRRQAEIAQVPVEEGYQLAQKAIEQALAIEPQSVAALTELAWVEFNYLHNIHAAATHFERALALNPRNYNLLANAAVFLHDVGQTTQAIRLSEYAAKYDPLNSRVHANLGLNYLSAGRLDDAITSSQKALQLSPKRVIAHYNIAVAYLLKGQNELALSEIEQESSDNFRLIGRCMVLHSLGQNAAALQHLNELIAQYEKDSAFNIAYVLAWRGEADRAFEWLQKAVEYRDPGLAEILVEPMLVKLHRDPRWLAFLRQIERDPASLQNITLAIPAQL